MEGLTRRELVERGVAGGALLALPGLLLVPAEAGSADPAVRALARAVRGPVYVPGSHGYAVARPVYNQHYDGVRPRAIVQPVSVADVQAAVRWARRYRVRIVARSGGHSYAGYSTVAGGLVVDLRRLRSVSFSRARGRARIAAGAQLIDVYTALARSGATVPGGSCPSVGFGGLALGGGMGLAARRFGLTCDNVAAVRIVTADGHVRVCDGDTYEDLFWACRGGGGGNFGIVTHFQVRTHAARSAAWFFVSWPWSQASAALAAWQAWAPHTTDRLTSILSLTTGPGGPRVEAFGQYFGAPGALRGLVRPLTRVAGARLTSGASGYGALMRRWAGCLDLSLAACHTAGTAPGGTLPRARFAAKSDYVAHPLPARGRAAAIAAIERRQRAGGPSGALLLDAYGGAINRVAADRTAFVHRSQLFCIQYLSYYAPGAGGAAQAWLNGAHAALRPYVSGQAYQNYIDPHLRGWRPAYYGANYDRLVEVKHRYDPDRLFHFAQAIA